jgi:hypothetical protein
VDSSTSKRVREAAGRQCDPLLDRAADALGEDQACARLTRIVSCSRNSEY